MPGAEKEFIQTGPRVTGEAVEFDVKQTEYAYDDATRVEVWTASSAPESLWFFLVVRTYANAFAIEVNLDEETVCENMNYMKIFNENVQRHLTAQACEMRTYLKLRGLNVNH